MATMIHVVAPGGINYIPVIYFTFKCPVL